METTIEQTAIMRKTVELCQAILDQPETQDLRQRIDAFMADDKLKSQYESLVDKGNALHEKQHQGLPLTGEEIADFEQHRDTLLRNPVARNYLEAQEQLNDIQKTIKKYVGKTLELGRVPSEDELGGGGCCGSGSGGGGGGCGCH